MNDKNLHISNLKEKETSLFLGGKINWKKSEAEVWNELSRKIEDGPTVKKISFIPTVIKYAAAAIVFLLVGLSAATFFYSKTIESLPGKHMVAELPDGSVVDLNAGSTVKYYPLKWKFERKIEFEGEAFFDVQKGKQFEVESLNGITRVLGTSFNIYARNDQYRVTCFTGKVKVVSNSNESVLLYPNSYVEIKKGKLVVKTKIKTENVVGWINNQFFFAGCPLKEVIDEIERQYAVTIRLQPELNNRNFSSNFSKKYNVEEVLDFICKSMQIKFVKQSESVFLIVEKN